MAIRLTLWLCDVCHPRLLPRRARIFRALLCLVWAIDLSVYKSFLIRFFNVPPPPVAFITGTDSLIRRLGSGEVTAVASGPDFIRLLLNPVNDSTLYDFMGHWDRYHVPQHLIIVRKRHGTEPTEGLDRSSQAQPTAARQRR